MFGLFRKTAKSYQVSLPEYDLAFEVQPRQTVLAAALEAGVAWPKRCQVGSCGTCKCRLVDGQIKPQLDFGYVLPAQQIQAGYILACQSTLKSDVIIDVKLKNGK